MVATVPAKRGRKPAAPAAQATGQVQSLTRGLKLLESIAESHGSVALTELAQQAGLPNSTTHRLLTTMQQLGFVRQVGELGHWSVGAHAFIVGSSFLQSRNLMADCPSDPAQADGRFRRDGQPCGTRPERPSGHNYRPGTVYPTDAHVRADWREAADARFRRG